MWEGSGSWMRPGERTTGSEVLEGTDGIVLLEGVRAGVRATVMHFLDKAWQCRLAVRPR